MSKNNALLDLNDSVLTVELDTSSSEADNVVEVCPLLP